MSSSLPIQVQRDIEEIERHEAAQKAHQEGSAPTDSITQPVAEPVVTEAVAPVDESTPVAVEPAVQKETVSKSEDADYWKQRFNTVQGLLSQQSSQGRDAAARVQELSSELNALREQINKPVEVAPASAITDADREAFGEDLIELQQRIVRETVNPLQAKIAAMEAENANLRSQVGQTGNQIATMGFEQKLALKIPDFETVNADPRWVEWLDEIDPMLQGPRRTVAQAAFESGNVDSLAHYVALWRQGTNQVVARVTAAKDELRSQVAPSRTAAASAPVGQAADKLYTEREAASLFDKVADLNRRGKYDDANKLEAELTSAYNSGRVR